MAIHFRFAPTPATLVHWISVFAMLTLHPLAVYVVPYVVPVVPYVADTGLPLVGPRFVPVRVTTVPPLVVIVVPPVALLVEGGEYEVVATEAALPTPSTKSIQTYPVPTPAAVVHVTTLPVVVVEHPVALWCVTQPSLL